MFPTEDLIKELEDIKQEALKLNTLCKHHEMLDLIIKQNEVLLKYFKAKHPVGSTK